MVLPSIFETPSPICRSLNGQEDWSELTKFELEASRTSIFSFRCSNLCGWKQDGAEEKLMPKPDLSGLFAFDDIFCQKMGRWV